MSRPPHRAMGGGGGDAGGGDGDDDDDHAAEADDDDDDDNDDDNDCLFVCLFVGGNRSRGLPLEDLPEEPSHLHLICQHSRERRGGLHKVLSPGALQLKAHPQDVLQVLLLLPTKWACRVRPLDPFPGFPK
jgi:hypothetical protein